MTAIRKIPQSLSTVTVAELATALHRSRRWVRDNARAGLIPGPINPQAAPASWRWSTSRVGEWMETGVIVVDSDPTPPSGIVRPDQRNRFQQFINEGRAS